MKPVLLGCIADDFTGATDLANNLVRAGMRVVQAIGVPDGPLAARHLVRSCVVRSCDANRYERQSFVAHSGG